MRHARGGSPVACRSKRKCTCLVDCTQAGEQAEQKSVGDGWGCTAQGSGFAPGAIFAQQPCVDSKFKRACDL